MNLNGLSHQVVQKEINNLLKLQILADVKPQVALAPLVKGVLDALNYSTFTINEVRLFIERTHGLVKSQEEILDTLSILYQIDVVKPYGPERWIDNLYQSPNSNLSERKQSQMMRDNNKIISPTSLYVRNTGKTASLSLGKSTAWKNSEMTMGWTL